MEQLSQTELNDYFVHIYTDENGRQRAENVTRERVEQYFGSAMDEMDQYTGEGWTLFEQVLNSLHRQSGKNGFNKLVEWGYELYLCNQEEFVEKSSMNCFRIYIKLLKKHNLEYRLHEYNFNQKLVNRYLMMYTEGVLAFYDIVELLIGLPDRTKFMKQLIKAGWRPEKFPNVEYRTEGVKNRLKEFKAYIEKCDKKLRKTIEEAVFPGIYCEPGITEMIVSYL